MGAYQDDDAGSSSGSAYVFTRSGTTWSQQAKLTASDASSTDLFGVGVDISGDTIVVGAELAAGGTSSSGAAYVFTRSGTTWSQQAKLTASDAAFNDRFGRAVAIAGDTIVVGAHGDEDAGPLTGSAYIFTRSGTTWSQQAKLTASDAAGLDVFGISAGISGDAVVIGAYGDDDAGSDAGSAYVFTRSGTTWSQQAKITAADAAAQDRFGVEVDISGDTIVVGAYTDGAGQDSGSAYVFTRSGTAWSQQAEITASDAAPSDRLVAVSIAGDVIVVGATLDDDLGTNTGSAYVFTRTGTSWTQQTKLRAQDAQPSDYFGVATAIDGDTIAVGAYATDALLARDSGASYVYRLDGDDDGLSDYEEANVHSTDPLNDDSDGDGLGDGDEVDVHGTNPNNADSDGDGLSDGTEINTHGSNPWDTDSDDDGLSDGDEVNSYGTDPTTQDSDGDLLSDPAEVQTHGTDPNDRDTDNDSWDDFIEITCGSDPLNDESPPFCLLVSDDDGDDVEDSLEPTLCANENPNLLSDGHCTGTDYASPTADDVVSDAVWLLTGERP